MRYDKWPLEYKVPHLSDRIIVRVLLFSAIHKYKYISSFLHRLSSL